MKKTDLSKYNPLIYFFIIFFLILILFVPAFKASLLLMHELVKGMLNHSYKLNGWIVLFLIVFATIGFFWMLYKIYYTKPKRSFYANYRNETIKNMVWKWSWRENAIESLWCYCPTCNHELAYNTDFLLHKITFSCQTCHQEIGKVDGENINHVLTYIKKEIRRSIKREEIERKKSHNKL